jgi:spermidine/putrescine transport system ATP-binding protein
MDKTAKANSTAEVELVEVTKQFGDLTAVDRVSLLIDSSEFLTLLGPSGCGKTTLLRMIGGFIAPDSGKVLLGGQDVTFTPPYHRDVCTVFQQYALFPHMTVSQNVAFGLERRRVARDQIKPRVTQALEMVQLSGLEQRRPSELSGGQQQRVALARAIVLQPRVLLLDEPLAALDLKLRKQMQLELKGLQRRLGISFIYVTHDQEEALTMSDRIAVINRGHVEQIGAAADVYERPQTEFVADFVGLSNIFEGTVAIAEGKTLVAKVDDFRVEIEEPDGGDQGGRAPREIGRQIRFMVRPEKIMVFPAPSGWGPSDTVIGGTGAEDASTPGGASPGTEITNTGIPGTVESAFYLGESTRWQIRLAGGQEIQAIQQNSGSRGSPKLEIGQQVSIGWAPGTAVIL